MKFGRAIVLSVAAVLCGCLEDNPNVGDTSSGGATLEMDGSGSMEPGGMLRCSTEAGQSCTLLLVSESLDDRVEVFAPFDTEVYRGAIDVDLRPGANLSPNSPDLDEPFGLAVTEDFVHVMLGHYPLRTSGSMVSFPRTMLRALPAGEDLRAADYFDGITVEAPVVLSEFGQIEPIFLNSVTFGPTLLAAAFGNDLFAEESGWTLPGSILAISASDPTNLATRSLDGFMGGDCPGAAQLVLSDSQTAAIACDGNDAVAFVSLGMPDSPATALAETTGTICPLPTATLRRVRAVAPDGFSGVLVAIGPADALGSGEVYRVGPDCAIAGPLPIGDMGRAVLGDIIPIPGSEPAWWLASGGPRTDALRGIFVIRAEGGRSLRLCGPLEGFEAHWASVGSQPLSPRALATTPTGTALAVTAVTADPTADDGMFGKVLWATLEPATDPCETVAEVIDLTNGAFGRAPLPDPLDRTSWRRGPSVAILVETSP